jgi:hypothetical protein
MANPNIINVSTIYGNTATLAVTTAQVNVVANPASSAAIYKVNQLIVTNACTTTLGVTLQINSGGSATTIGSNVAVPPSSMLVILGKDTQTYLLENTSLQMNTSAVGYITAICSWEQVY